MPSFSAVLLAGGQSKRMGRDKALLSSPDPGFVLWQWQLRTLKELQADEIFWSGPARSGVPDQVQLISDTVEKAGPLAGISACLNILQSDLLVVLAIDLPQMNAAYLKGLLTRCSPSCGAVARHGDFFEPLAAIYPKGLRGLADEHLRQGRYAMQDLIREAVEHRFLEAVPLSEQDVLLFKNLNSPNDL